VQNTTGTAANECLQLEGKDDDGSIFKFNQQKHTTRGMEFNIQVQSTKAHNLCGMEFNIKDQ
jgi:hypothetical protein